MDELADRIVQFLSTLPARGATLGHLQPLPADVISIHAPREGSDTATASNCWSTEISIHAPREGSDGRRKDRGGQRHNFYPRSPRGERRWQ